MKTTITKHFLIALGLSLITITSTYAAGWCGASRKVDCGGWVVQFNLFGGGSLDGGDCVNYNGCVSNARWDWSNPGVWTQMLLEKEGFCGKNYRVSNTQDFRVSYNGSFSGNWGNRRLAIVSWAKTADNCNWTTNNLYELYIHERSFEQNNYSSWCTYKGESPNCSGSTYKLYDCGYQIIGRSIRCWRNNQRTSGTTDVDCLWEAWRSKGIAPDVYYYFTEVGCEAGPNSGGRFTINNPNMVRVANGGGNNGGGNTGGGSANIVNNGVYRLKCNWGNKMLHVTGNWSGANVNVKNRNNSQWSQQWVLRKVSGDVYRLQNRWTGKYLLSTGNSNNANVTANNLNTNWGSQKWRLRKVSGNVYRLENQWGSKYLSGRNTDGGNVTVHTVNNNWGSQKWTLEYTGSTAREGAEDEIQPAANDFNVYNNKGSDLLTVSGNQINKVAIYNLNGQIKWESESVSDLYEINTSDFQSGIYVIKAYDIIGNINTEKIVLN